MISKSPERNTFQARNYREKLELDPTDENARQMVDWYDQWEQDQAMREQDPAWQKDNMEYDLRTSELMLAKVRASDGYAQNLYAAMCNNEFQHNDVWPILTDKTWSCSWRHAGGIVADMQEKGDYIDWYCSGIRNDADTTDEEFQAMSKEQQEQFLYLKNNYVGESFVTDEIREDLLTLGWIVLETKE